VAATEADAQPVQASSWPQAPQQSLTTVASGLTSGPLPKAMLITPEARRPSPKPVAAMPGRRIRYTSQGESKTSRRSDHRSLASGRLPGSSARTSVFASS
jgi:hypothetical protein